MKVGDIIEISYEDEKNGVGFFSVMTKSSHTTSLGGQFIESKKDSITTNGTPVYNVNNSQWQFKVDVLNEFDLSKNKQVAVILKEQSLARKETKYTITYADMSSAYGYGRPQGDFESDNEGKIAVEFGGGSKLKLIV
jgi:hypothetical protein